MLLLKGFVEKFLIYQIYRGITALLLLAFEGICLFVISEWTPLSLFVNRV